MKGEGALLSGLRVVEISAFVAAPLCGATLASLGADVVRVDPPGGGVDHQRWPLHNGRSLYWAGLNQGKRSVNVDMRSDRGREVVIDLIAAAGVCVTNLPVGAWMSYDILRTRRDDVVMLAITGNPDGTAAVDYTVNAAVGFPWITGPAESSEPVNHVLPAWDVITAQMGVTAIVAAELRRARTGSGSHIELSLANVALSTVSHLGLLAEAELENAPRARYGNYLYGSFGRDFRTADGRRVIVIALTPRQWRSLVAATQTGEEIAALQRARQMDFEKKEADRFACRAELAGVFERWIGERPLGVIRSVFDSNGVLWGPYQTFKELVAEDARASASNPLFTRVTQPGIGALQASASPLVFAGVPRTPPSAAPEMGAHTREVLGSWLGLSAREIEDLSAAGVIPT